MMTLPCGFWCPKPENEDPNQSYGICQDCEQILIDQSDARQFNKGLPPSYVSDRKEFNEYIEEKNKRA